MFQRNKDEILPCPETTHLDAMKPISFWPWPDPCLRWPRLLFSHSLWQVSLQHHLTPFTRWPKLGGRCSGPDNDASGDVDVVGLVAMRFVLRVVLGDVAFLRLRWSCKGSHLLNCSNWAMHCLLEGGAVTGEWCYDWAICKADTGNFEEICYQVLGTKFVLVSFKEVFLPRFEYLTFLVTWNLMP